jgi:F-type H+-transporting ATPase subunit b
MLAVLTVAPRSHLHAQATPASSTEAAPKAEPEVDETYTYKHSQSVTAFGKMLGMNANQASTAFEWLNFLVFAGLVGYGAVKMLPKAFRDRSAAIERSLVEARIATEAATARLGTVEARLSKLDEEIGTMRSRALQDASADEQRIKATVEDEKRKIIAAAEQEIAAATTHARRQLQVYAADLAIDQAARKLVVSAETDRLLVQEFARSLTGDEKGGQN